MMKQNLTKRLVIALVLALGLLLQFNLAFADEKKTDATVRFTYGQLEWKEPGIEEGDGMNLDFDEHPTPMEYVEYNSINGPHLLRICDARDPALPSEWKVMVTLSSFELSGGSGDEFMGKIILENPSEVLGQSELQKQQEITVISGGGETLVMSGTAMLGRGVFDTKWADADTWLIIEASEAETIVEGSYKAEMTWMLSTGP